MERPVFSNSFDMVMFHVGNDGDEEKFMVHREHVCSYSPAFKAAFNSSFVEGQTQSYRLDDIRPDSFRLFVQWLYTQEFCIWDEISLAGAEPTSEMALTTTRLCQERDLNIIQLWLLADKFLIPRLQNDAMRHFVKILENQNYKHKDIYRSTHWIPYVYAEGRTTLDSPLRHLAVDLCLYSTSSSWSNAHPDHFPHQMLMELNSQIILSRETGHPRHYRHIRPDRNYLVVEDKPQCKEAKH